MEPSTLRRVGTLPNDSRYGEYNIVSLGISKTIRVDMMSEDIREIRKKRLAEALSKLDGDDEKERQEVMETLPWAFRLNKETGFYEILQEGNMVAITQDPQFGLQVCEMFNRLTLIKETFGEDEHE